MDTAASNKKMIRIINEINAHCIENRGKTEPMSYEEAWGKHEWDKAIKEEMKSLGENQMWNLITTTWKTSSASGCTK